MHFRCPGTYTFLFYVMHCAVGRVDLCPFCLSPRAVPFFELACRLLFSHPIKEWLPPSFTSCLVSNEFCTSDDSLSRFTVLLRVHFNALELPLHRARQTAAWRPLFPS
jgi:hypothetical protein